MRLVVGATGMLGTEICRQLAAEGEAVRALVRPTSDPARVRELRELGIATIEGDLRDPASLAAACTGIACVLTTATAIVPRAPGDSLDATDRDGGLALVAAAENAGVSHVVQVSISTRVDVDCALVRAKRAVEDRLRASTQLAHTILRPTAFMDVWLSPTLGFDIAQGRAHVAGSGRARVSWIAMRDVARFAVAATRHPLMRNATLDLGGPRALGLLEVVQLCEELGCPPFELEFTDEDTLEREWRTTIEEPACSYAALTLALSRGDSIAMQRLLDLVPFGLGSVEQHVARALRRLPAAQQSYRYVSKNPEPRPLTGLPDMRPESSARPFI